MTLAAATSGGAAAPKLRVEALAKRYGAVDALKPTNLSVAPGEFLTLLGPSGSGKTTLLQMICGLAEPTAGRVFIDGRDETATPVHRRDIGLVFQHYGLFPHLTVAENIGFPLRMRGCPKEEMEERVGKALEMVQLDRMATRFPRELSGGQQQRVALARCFIYRPSVILMDEPLGALDRKLREHMQLEIRRLHRETGATIVYVTHDQEEALALSDRICLMNHAEVEQVATPAEIYARPKTAFAADFIGISNILRGTIERGEGGERRLATPHGALPLPDSPLPEGSAALVVRPEQIEMGGAGDSRLGGSVSEMIYAGSETRMIVTLPAGENVMVRLPAKETLPRLGDTVEFSWNSSQAVLVP
ncbi:ABC transporter ATP-binding protein [Enterovirga sp.]|uniref:ABC transporter ATP-binding protein n=1 Tax=Enterovirga sp. TaxID=2026350 RepID=UPI002BDE1ACA|nr:ABC transporter ATP-binding protein [Enterovirga sp.]HMO28038.1 ABC transporter ATP-binding protein [Enterovirga sp.]